ncbi:DUF427-domain-containing protein [Hymenopellis radicata]|nr:DUF427-domain-containing protein [Hymenopellis radicata]
MAPPTTSLTGNVEDAHKRIRVLFGGTFHCRFAQSQACHKFYPLHYFPIEELPTEFIQAKRTVEDHDLYDVYTSGNRAGLFNIQFDAMDAWFEEDEKIYIHPKDPYKRVDVLQSSKHIRVEVDGVEVANTTKPRLLFETSLITRTYIPMTDCRLDLLVPSELTTGCPYKGEASYYHIQVSPNNRKENVVWWYRNPNLECAAINGFLAFYDEKVDVWVDGVKQEQPSSGQRA